MDQFSINGSVQVILKVLGCADQPGTAQTPARVAKFLTQFCTRPPINMTVFREKFADEMVIVGPISFASLCEHHMLPFFGEAFVGYLPGGEDDDIYRLVGLSKLARVVDHFSAGLNNQERITAQIGRMLTSDEALRPQGVGVIMRGTHTCMTIRGVKQPCACTTTQFFSGPFKGDPATRQEFIAETRARLRS